MSVRRQLSCVLLVLLVLCGQAMAADFPTKPITLICPYPAGGSTDVIARPLAEAAGKILGQPVLVENKGGGGGAVGTGSIIGKEPDGYLLSIVVTSLHRAAHINKLSFDTVKDVTPIIRVGGYLYGVLVRPDSKLKTLPELIQAAKAKPGELTYMASGIGTGGHIAAEEMAANAGVKFNHLPSKGDQESSASLLGGPRRFHLDHLGLDPPGRGRAAQAPRDLRRRARQALPGRPDREGARLQGGARLADRHRRAQGHERRAREGPARRFPEGAERPGLPESDGLLRDAGALPEHGRLHQVLGRRVRGGRRPR